MHTEIFLSRRFKTKRTFSGVDLRVIAVKKISMFFVLTILLSAFCAVPAYGAGADSVLIVTNYINMNKSDVSSDVQKLIDENPNRTLYFPDGIYPVSKPIVTPANPEKSVDLQLSNYAVIKATENFDGEALIRLGGKDASGSNRPVGSNYSLTGGILDSSGITGGITVESGRETRVQNVSIKNAVCAIHIFYGANNGSADCDISDVNITGNDTKDSVGILIDAHDNTLRNIRLSNISKGVIVKGSANYLINVHPLFCSDFSLYGESIGFYDEGGNNTFQNCYSDQFAVAFRLGADVQSRLTDCYCFWWTDRGEKETAILCDGSFNSVVTNLKVDFSLRTDNTVLDGTYTGTGELKNLMVDEARLNSNFSFRLFREHSVLHRIRLFLAEIADFFIKIYRQIYGLRK